MFLLHFFVVIFFHYFRCVQFFFFSDATTLRGLCIGNILIQYIIKIMCTEIKKKKHTGQIFSNKMAYFLNAFTTSSQVTQNAFKR